MSAIEVFDFTEKLLFLPVMGTGGPIMLRRSEKLHRVIQTRRKGVIVPH